MSSSSESDKPSRQGSVKRIVRSLSAILRPSSEGDDLELMLQPTASLLHEVGEALLHVYRSKTFPTEGLNAFHQKVSCLAGFAEWEMRCRFRFLNHSRINREFL